MARYQLLNPMGVHDSQAPAHDVFPSNYTEWHAYQLWLAAGNVPDPAAPPIPQYPTLASQRTEMLARLDAEFHRRMRTKGQFTSLGHTWNVRLYNAIVLPRVISPLPAGFSLPDAARVQVPLSNAQVNQLNLDLTNYFVAVNARFAALVTAINASATPLTVNITTGWP